MRCRQCEHENAEGYIFCENCGEKLPKEEKAAPVYVPASEDSAVGHASKEAADPVQKEPATQAASPAPQVVVIERERKRRFPGWLWLLLGLLLGPICLCTLAWASIVALPDGVAGGIEGAADLLGDGIGEPVGEVITDIQRRQTKNPPIIGGDGEIGDIAGNICDDWPFPWLPFNCPGEGPVAIAMPEPAPAGNKDPAPEAPEAPAAAQPDNNNDAEKDDGDICRDYTPFNEFHTVTYYNEAGDLYLVVNTDGGVEQGLDYWIESPLSGGLYGCAYNSSIQMVCRIAKAEELPSWQGTLAQASIFVEINPNDPFDRCYLITEMVDIPWPEEAEAEAEEEDEDEGGGRSSCSSGYYQVEGKPDGFCCPNGTTYNSGTNACDY